MSMIIAKKIEENQEEIKEGEKENSTNYRVIQFKRCHLRDFFVEIDCEPGTYYAMVKPLSNILT